MNQAGAIAVAVLLACAGCATAPPEAPAPAAQSADPRIGSLQQLMDEALAAEPAAVRRRYVARVVAVEQTSSGLLFDLEVERAASFGRDPRRFNLAAACGSDAMADCVRKAMAAIRGAATVD